MKTVFAILAMALATLAVPALSADDSDDDAATRADIDELADEIKDLASSLRTLQRTVDSLVSTAATINTNVSDLTNRGQVAVVMTRPSATNPGLHNATTYLLGSSIPDFPAGTVATDGSFIDRKLPAGTYLFELQKPSYGDNMVCHGSVSQYFAARRFRDACPYVWLNVQRGDDHTTKERLDDGFRVFRSDGTSRFWVRHGFPTDWSFEDKPARHYTGAVKITKLK